MRKAFHVLAISVMMTCAAGTLAAAEPASSYLHRPMPDAWSYDGAMEQTLPSDDEWWHSFDDPRLDSLISMGVDNNFNLAIAARRREVARLAVTQAKSAYYPSVGVSASYQRSRSAGQDMNAYSLAADVSWEVDLFGKITSAVKASKADYNASRAEYLAAMVSLTADIATYYVNCRVTAMRLQVAREHLESQERVMKITQARYEAGLVSKLDVAQAQVVYLNTESTIPALETSYANYFNALALILGVYPDELFRIFPTRGQLPAYERIIPAGIPADLLRRRPDVVAAEYELAGQAARLGIAKKDFLPTLTINGSVGVKSNDIGELFDNNSFSYSVGPTLSWTIFDGFARKAAVASAREQMQSAIETYNLTVMTAVEEVNNSLATYQSALRTMEIDQKVVDQSRESFNLSVDQYKQGLSPFTNVVNAQIDWLSAANSLVAAHGQALISLINIYKALGGSPLEN